MLKIESSAARRIAELLTGKNEGAFRIEVQGGGCAGFKYHFSVDNPYCTNSDDTMIIIDHRGTVHTSTYDHDRRGTNNLNKTDDIIATGDTAPQFRIVIDSASFAMLTDSTIEYKQNLGGASFEITNPRAKAVCGCGLSFSSG